ncbi:Auxin responsive SAUR protein [Quillaja saponaria]|uniref:Auxin responsive SAUR protein n=1 Tax=Quillaja saponaria TaxID=32244 RepID=A0AAD7QCX6_QUISA|nr:Auxin responsive SAUR protein [Quillaja saponaria]
MAKGGKLMKLKSVFKKWNSFGNNKHIPSRSNLVSAVVTDDEESQSDHLHPVYVGKSRRRYLVTSDLIDRPLFRELVERSRDSQVDDENDTINVACEVVLFEHLLWMLENADPQPESLDELVDFYAC